MQKDFAEHNRAREQAIRLLEEAEKKRASIRLERGLVELENHRFQILKNQEFTVNIGPYLYEQYTKNRNNKILGVLDILLLQLAAGDGDTDSIIISILERIGEDALHGSNIGLIRVLCRKFIESFKKTDKNLLLSHKICRFLEGGCILLIRSNLWEDVEALLSSLWERRTLSFDTVNGPQQRAPQILSAVGKNDILEKILQYHNNGDQDIRLRAQNILKKLGDNAIPYLFNRLVYSVTREERFLIMGLIGGFGEQAVEEIKKCLDKDLPWYVIRNMIYVITELGDPGHYSLVEGYLLHPDIRIQQQLINAIIKLGGYGVEKRLAQALLVVRDEIKIKLVMKLGTYGGEDIANSLVDLLHKKHTISVKIRDELILTIVVSLRSFPYQRVLDSLRRLLAECREDSDRTRAAIIAIEETINVVEPQLRHLTKGQRAGRVSPSYGFDPEEEYTATKRVAVFMDEISSMLSRGEREGASSKIYRKIVDSAKVKDFKTAELLRDKLLSINPDALQDVIRVAEIIEEEKNSPISNQHMEVWEELYEKMSTEEYDSFCQCLAQENYKTDEIIVRTNEINPCLYFINSGAIRLSCQCNDEEIFLRRLKTGDVIGVGQFFSVSVWTVTLIAQQDTELHVLRRENFLKVAERFPEIEEKLYNYCSRKEEIPSLVRMSGKDRRNHARYPVRVIVINTLLDQYGGSTGRRVFQGEMADISKGGLSFFIRISARKNAHLLLGRQIISEIHLRGNDSLQCSGVVVGVRYHNEVENEFSIHVKFYSEIDQRRVTDVLNLVI